MTQQLCLPKFKFQADLAGGRGACIIGSNITDKRVSFFMNLISKADHFYDYAYFVWNMTTHAKDIPDHIEAQKNLPHIGHV